MTYQDQFARIALLAAGVTLGTADPETAFDGITDCLNAILEALSAGVAGENPLFYAIEVPRGVTGDEWHPVVLCGTPEAAAVDARQEMCEHGTVRVCNHRGEVLFETDSVPETQRVPS
jgi:hypothetical protein